MGQQPERCAMNFKGLFGSGQIFVLPLQLRAFSCSCGCCRCCCCCCCRSCCCCCCRCCCRCCCCCRRLCVLSCLVARAVLGCTFPSLFHVLILARFFGGDISHQQGRGQTEPGSVP